MRLDCVCRKYTSSCVCMRPVCFASLCVYTLCCDVYVHMHTHKICTCTLCMYLNKRLHAHTQNLYVHIVYVPEQKATCTQAQSHESMYVCRGSMCTYISVLYTSFRAYILLTITHARTHSHCGIHTQTHMLICTRSFVYAHSHTFIHIRSFAHVHSYMPIRTRSFIYAQPSAIVRLNVGGKRIDVKRSTVTKHSSLLSSMLSGRWDHVLMRDKEVIYVYVYICVCVCIYVCNTHVYIYVYFIMLSGRWDHVLMRDKEVIYVYMCVCIYICMYVIHTCVYICIFYYVERTVGSRVDA